MTELVPRTLDTATIGEDGTDEWMSERYRPRPRAVRAPQHDHDDHRRDGGRRRDERDDHVPHRPLRARRHPPQRRRRRRGRRDRARGGIPAAQDRAAGDRHRRPAISASTSSAPTGREDRPPALVLCPLSLVDDVRHRIGDAPAEVLPVPSDSDRLDPATIVATLHARGLAAHRLRGRAVAREPVRRSRASSTSSASRSLRCSSRRRHPFISLTDRIESAVAGMLVDDAGFSYLRLRPRS